MGSYGFEGAKCKFVMQFKPNSVPEAEKELQNEAKLNLNNWKAKYSNLESFEGVKSKLV